jgi:hypothetical protein
MKGPGYYFYELIFGKYSSRLNRYCQQKDIPTPYKLCYHDDPDHHIYEIFFPNTKFQIYHISERIEFQKTSFLSSLKQHRKRFKRIYGYSILRIEDKDLRVFCYRKDVFGHRTKVLYYFLGDEFIMGEYIFMSYSKEKVESIGEKLASLYHVQLKSKEESFYIEDDYQGRIMFNDTGFEINVKFFSLRNEAVNDFLYNYFTREEEEESPAPQ